MLDAVSPLTARRHITVQVTQSPPIGARQGSDELALCYYKNKADSEVRGWIYLKDMTEITEEQDTMILASLARTLHLYAQTRAEQNVWVTGLAKLCPHAFVKLERERRPEYCS